MTGPAQSRAYRDLAWVPPVDTPCKRLHAEFADYPPTEPAHARAMCAPCPFTGLGGPCFAAAMRHEAGLPATGRAGVWGGTTPLERAQIAAVKAA